MQSIAATLVSLQFRLAWTALAWVCTAFTAFHAFRPHPQPTMLTPSDWLDHLLAFAALSVTWSLAGAAGRARRRSVVLALLLAGAAIEVIQIFIPGRTAELGDWFADGVGIALGWAIVVALLTLAGRSRDI